MSRDFSFKHGSKNKEPYLKSVFCFMYEYDPFVLAWLYVSDCSQRGALHPCITSPSCFFLLCFAFLGGFCLLVPPRTKVCSACICSLSRNYSQQNHPILFLCCPFSRLAQKRTDEKSWRWHMHTIPKQLPFLRSLTLVTPGSSSSLFTTCLSSLYTSHTGHRLHARIPAHAQARIMTTPHPPPYDDEAVRLAAKVKGITPATFLSPFILPFSASLFICIK